MKDLLFQMGFSTLLVHELDAMTQAEWRLLFVLRRLPEPIARDLFVLLHVPAIAVLLWLTQHPSIAVRRWTKAGLALFMVVHAGLHWNLRNHPLNTFTPSLSLSLIYGAALLGFLYVASAFLLDMVLSKPD